MQCHSDASDEVFFIFYFLDASLFPLGFGVLTVSYSEKLGKDQTLNWAGKTRVDVKCSKVHGRRALLSIVKMMQPGKLSDGVHQAFIHFSRPAQHGTFLLPEFL